MWEYRAQVVRVIDGDTVDVDIDLGLHVHTQARVRLLGVNAAEHNTPEGRAAEQWVADWVTKRTNSDQPFTIRTEKDHTEKYGRWLAALIGPDGADLSTDLLSAGHAKPWDGVGKRPV